MNSLVFHGKGAAATPGAHILTIVTTWERWLSIVIVVFFLEAENPDEISIFLEVGKEFQYLKKYFIKMKQNTLLAKCGLNLDLLP